MWLAFKRVAPPMFLGVLPALVLVIAAQAAVHRGVVGVDFRGELYPEAKLVLRGSNPFPAPHADLGGGVNRIFPVTAALLVAPLTLLPPAWAAAVFVALLLAALMATVRVLGVTDWRIYGIVLVWPASIAALQSGNLTILLALLAAVAWRYRDRRYVSGLAIGAAIALKLFLWPLLVWLLAIRRFRSAAAGVVVAGCSLLFILPFTSLFDYVQVIDHLGDTFAPDSYNLVGLLMQSGATGLAAAKLVADALGGLTLVVAYGRRSMPLSIAASLLLSPIVWLHYFVLLLLPLGIGLPRLSIAWFVPLALYACPGSFQAVRERDVIIALVVLTVVTVVSERPRPWHVRPKALGTSAASSAER